jgi:DNA polymerase-3 subunit gamma/tau
VEELVASKEKKQNPEQKTEKKTVQSAPSPKQESSGKMDANIQQEWPSILQAIKQQRVTLYAWLADGEIVQTTPQTITIAMKSVAHRDTVMKPENKQIIEQQLQHSLQHRYEIIAFTREEWEQQRGQVETSATTSSPLPSSDDIVEKAIAFFGEDLVTVKK